jgi:hypothetical protein
LAVCAAEHSSPRRKACATTRRIRRCVHIPLANRGTFTVDYLDKNLRVKIKGGKQYNFADPMGNADNLFVFHRDVEKARERLVKGEPPATN